MIKNHVYIYGNVYYTRIQYYNRIGLMLGKKGYRGYHHLKINISNIVLDAQLI